MKLAVNYLYHTLAHSRVSSLRFPERRLGTSQMLLKMATNISGIPVVDFSAMSLQNESSVRENSDAVKQLADHVHQAFSTIGFVYLKNHGIPQEKVACKHV